MKGACLQEKESRGRITLERPSEQGYRGNAQRAPNTWAVDSHEQSAKRTERGTAGGVQGGGKKRGRKGRPEGDQFRGESFLG